MAPFCLRCEIHALRVLLDAFAVEPASDELFLLWTAALLIQPPLDCQPKPRNRRESANRFRFGIDELSLPQPRLPVQFQAQHQNGLVIGEYFTLYANLRHGIAFGICACSKPRTTS